MRNKWWVVVVLLFMVSSLVLTSGCAKKAVKSDAEVSTAADQDAAALEAERARRAAEAEAARLAAEREAQRLADEARQREEARSQFVNEHVYFEFDRSDLTPAAVAVLKKKAAWMDNEGVAALVEGHCDERGTNEYNLALGERRARSAKDFLVNMGISASMLSTVSYGEERPLDPGHNEAAWEKNRRAQFVIK
jgi:peptidoglycan-associated lipoprotein